MTKRTKISKNEYGSVVLEAVDPYTGEQTRRVFYIRGTGGMRYVREDDSRGNDHQVCGGLGGRGNTLVAKDSDDLLDVIRREWKAYRKAAIKDADCIGWYGR